MTFPLWALARQLTGWRWTVAELPPGHRGLTDWTSRTITLSPGLGYHEWRCTAMHEATHAALRGPTRRRHTDVEELLVEEMAARRLIEWDALVAAVAATEDEHRRAWLLQVDVPMLRARLRGLSDAERREIGQLWD